MNTLATLYRHSLGLLTDLYQLTMAYGYWKSGLAECHGVFHLFFRRKPFHGGYAVAAGLGYVQKLLAGFHFTDEDTAYLAGLVGADDMPLFEPGFLDHLRQMRFTCDV